MKRPEHPGISHSPSVYLAAILITVLSGCSAEACSRHVASPEEARRALSTFFNSNSAAAERLIVGLRHRGMTDEVLAVLKSGCRPCYVFRGDETHYLDPTRWYISKSISQGKDKVTAVLEINCPTEVLLKLSIPPD